MLQLFRNLLDTFITACYGHRDLETLLVPSPGFTENYTQHNPGKSKEETHMFDGYCQIRRAGVTEAGQAQLDLKADDGSFDWSWFVSKPTYTREILAAALTAIACNKKIYCQIGDPVQAWAEVIRFGLAK